MTNQSWAWERLERGNVGSQTTLLELVDPQPVESLLDVGTGSGGLALLAARTRKAQVTGIDIAADGIERARERAAAEGLDVRFHVGDAQSCRTPTKSSTSLSRRSASSSPPTMCALH